MARDVDGRRWWLKMSNNPQGPKVLVNDYVVGSVARLIDAPACEVAVARIPEELDGYEYAPGLTLRAGWLVHASRHVEDAFEARGELTRLDRDDNSSRAARIVALYDWCWGADDQWLYCQTDDQKVYSHDHGHYLPKGPSWTIEDLQAVVDQPHLPNLTTRLDPEALRDAAAKIGAVTRSAIRSILCSVPASWAVSDQELEALGWFLERRAGEVGRRLRSAAGGGS
ncbi:MAG TPA: hypothetical protein VNP94_02865 [Actinomycetota bacterium]|nr:hypothetical protein [Actinomycetota bacterium]